MKKAADCHIAGECCKKLDYFNGLAVTAKVTNVVKVLTNNTSYALMSSK